MTLDDCFPLIWLNDFNDQTTERVVAQIIAEAVADPESPITLYINSDGGYLDALTPIVEVIEQIANPLRTVCLGRAASAGAFLLSYGTKGQRYIGRNSYVMVHEISSGNGGHIKDQIINTNEADRLNKHWLTEFAKNCGTTYEVMQERLRGSYHRDLYLAPEEAKTFGLIDHIGVPPFHIKPRELLKPGRRTPKKATKKPRGRK